MSKCSYGCGQKAFYEFKNGNKCCSKSSNSCPAKRQRDSKKKKGINPFEGKEHHRCRKGIKPWNYGLTKKTDVRVKRGAKNISKALTGKPGHKHTEETKAQISQTMIDIGAGGYREGSGRGCKGKYKGIYCDSSWELAFVLWCEIVGHKVKRARKRFKYEFDGKVREYLPDFRYQNSEGNWKYLEVKGFVSKQWKAKKKAFPHELLFVGKKAMERKIFPLVIKTYGENFIELYE